jgi:hypothetical protein
MKRILLLLILLLSGTQFVLAQAPTTNDYFGGMMPGGNAMGVGNGDPDAPSGPGSGSAAGQGGMPKVGDLTGDEKRMRKKYSTNVQHAKDLIARGVDMEKKGKADGDPKLMKKGKIYQEIGKKALGDLEANIPAPDPDMVREKKERDANPTRL